MTFEISLDFKISVHTINSVNITFDTAKDAANLSKHGVSLALAQQLEWEWLRAKSDTRMNYEEPRMIGYAPIGERVYCVVFVDRGAVRRIISLRKANTREVNRYVEQT
ncbi:MAG: BrnT family toxin [Rugosibacter sp.]